MKQPDDIFSQMLPFWEHLTPQEQMALREASVPSTLPKGDHHPPGGPGLQGHPAAFVRPASGLSSVRGRAGGDTVPGAGR